MSSLNFYWQGQQSSLEYLIVACSCTAFLIVLLNWIAEYYFNIKQKYLKLLNPTKEENKTVLET